MRLDNEEQIWDELNNPNRVKVGDIVVTHLSPKVLKLVTEQRENNMVRLYNPKTGKLDGIPLWVGYLTKIGQ